MAKVTLKEIAHSYTGYSDNPDDYALKKLDLTWRNGGAYALLGPSGCGKTTLLYIVGGFVSPSTGVILVDNKPVTWPGPDRGPLEMPRRYQINNRNAHILPDQCGTLGDESAPALRPVFVAGAIQFDSSF